MFDVGVVQKILPIPGLEVGIDAYYKTARDLLDDGQFGAAYVLTGVQLRPRRECRRRAKVVLHQRQLPRLRQRRLGAADRAANVVSNQYLFDPDELAYIATHYDLHRPRAILTASAGASYFGTARASRAR